MNYFDGDLSIIVDTNVNNIGCHITMNFIIIIFFKKEKILWPVIEDI